MEHRKQECQIALTIQCIEWAETENLIFSKKKANSMHLNKNNTSVDQLYWTMGGWASITVTLASGIVFHKTVQGMINKSPIYHCPQSPILIVIMPKPPFPYSKWIALTFFVASNVQILPVWTIVLPCVIGWKHCDLLTVNERTLTLLMDTNILTMLHIKKSI